MRCIYLILKTIFCSSEFETKQHNCYIVTDRELKGLIMKDSLNTVILPFLEDSDNLKSDYLWDSYFPKPIFYEIKNVNTKNFNSQNSFEFVGITSEEKIMFHFKLAYNCNQIVLSDFFDSDNIPITNALFCNDEETIKIYMLSSKSKNVDSIKSSFKYIVLVDKIDPLYKEILNSLIRYIKNINYLSEDFKNFCDESVFSRLCKAKNSLISATILILRCQSSLSLPIFYKLDKLPVKERFESLLNELFRSLEDVVDIYLNTKNADERNKGIVLQKKDIIDYIRDNIIQNYLPSKCVQVYEKLTISLKNIDDHVNEVLNQEKANIEILSDCNIKNVDEFLGTYSDLFLSYCSIMVNSDDQIVFELCLFSEESEIDLLIQKLKDFFVDKLISHKLMYFVENYDDDNTNFMIFSQTNYFQYAFSSRILKNLNLLSTIKSFHNPGNETQKELTETFLQIDQEYFGHISKITKDWLSILKEENSDKVKSFSELL